MDREKRIIKTSVQGIELNITLVIFKAIVGFLANSIAIILDAVNNLSDAITAIITIIGAKLSNKAPDREHPFGHGRIEYFAAIIIATIVLAAGVISLKESIEKIITPQEAEYTLATFVVIIFAIIAKYFFGMHVKKVGKEVNSQSLVATGTDAYMDAVLSFSTLVGAGVSLLFHISIEGYLGVLISAFIIRSVVIILKDTVGTMIGERVDDELVKQIKDKINSFEEVFGTYDLVLHEYGPDRYIGSAHIEVSDNMKAKDIHALTRTITEEVYKEFNIILTIGIYASNDSGRAGEIKKALDNIVSNYPEVVQLHGFYVDEKRKKISFDLIIDFDAKDPEKTRDEITGRIRELFPEFEYVVVIDSNISD